MAQEASSGVSAKRGERDDEFAAALEALALTCDELGMREQAAMTRDWRLAPVAGRRRVFLPQESPVATDDSLSAPAPATNNERWRRKFLSIRRDHAAALVSLARRAIEDGEMALGYQWLHESLREDPDQPLARQTLDFRVVNGRWRRAGAPIRAEASRVRHPHFGFEAGKYWRIDSAHFRITTNHSPEAGTELAALLEEFHDVWRQLFVEYWTTADLLLKRFEKTGPVSRSRKKFRVTLVRDRAEYVRQLQARQPLIEKTVGIYFDRDAESFFYFGDQASRPTWYHETAHQLFQEAIDQPPGVGDEANFWAVEGAALYTESLRREAPAPDVFDEPRWASVTVGGYDADRLQFARYRALQEKFYVPLEDFTRLGKNDLQKDENLPMLYSQAAGLTHFLIDGEGGRHRERFVKYLTALYQRRGASHDGAAAMSQIWGDEFVQLDARYAAYLHLTDSEVIAVPPAPSIRNLCLGGTALTDRGLAGIAGCRSLEWLNLSQLAITDAGLAAMVDLTSLKNLSLEHTPVTDAGIEKLASLTQIEELDLSGTRISDIGLTAIARMTSLKTLWLTDTDVTSAGLSRLVRMKNLEALHLEGLALDEPSVARLQQALPSATIFR